MVILRFILGALVAMIGLLRLRIIFTLLGSTDTYKIRDTLSYYLMAKAISLGESPYQMLDAMAKRYFGIASFITSPAPCTPFTAILSLPLLLFSVEKAYIAWFWFEMICLVLIAIMLPILIKGKMNWKLTIVFLLLLLSWYPVMVDLLYGQLTLLLTTILLAALLAWRRDRKILTGVLTGFTVAIKMYTWPLVFYYLLKRDWRAFFSSCFTIAGLNLIALMVMGWGSFSDYYLKVTMQVSAVYHARLVNYSLWSIGYRFFEGTLPIGGNNVSAPPLISLPQIAPWISAGLAIVFLVFGLVWALRTKDKNIAYSIVLCVIIAVSPIAWDHYYLMLIICLVILGDNLSRKSFPYQAAIPFMIIVMLLFLLNSYIAPIIFSMNGGLDVLNANGNRITFASSLLEILPMVELAILTILLWRVGMTNQQDAGIEPIQSGIQG